ncbi:MAG: hypothetical protein ACPHID_07755 [Thermoplasmatota archaeon]
MRFSAFALLALLLVAPAMAQNGTMDECPAGQTMMDGGCTAGSAMDGGMEDDGVDLMPFVVLIAFAAVAFLLAKYGP